MDNTIALLTNIYKKLDLMSQQALASNSPAAKEEAVQRAVIDNKTASTGLASAAAQPEPITKASQVSGSAAVKSKIDKNISVKDIVSFLSSLPVSVKLVAGLSGRTLDRFETVLGKLSDSMVSFADKAEGLKAKSEPVKNFKMMADSISVLSKPVKETAALAPVIPLFSLSMTALLPAVRQYSKVSDTLAGAKDPKAAAEGLKAMSQLAKGMGVVVASSVAVAAAVKVIGIKGVLEGVGIALGIVTALSALALVVSGVSGRMQAVQKSGGFKDITVFISSMLAVTAATALLGVVVTGAEKQIITGLGGVVAVMAAYSAVAIGVAYAGSLVGGVAKAGALEQITKFAAWNIAITGATVLLGAVLKQGEGLLAAGFLGVAAVMAGYTLLSLGVLSLGGRLKAVEKTKALIDISKFIFGCMGMVAGTVALGYLVQRHSVEAAAGFTATAGIMLGIYGLAALSQRLTRGKTMINAAAAMTSLSKFMLLCGAAAGEVVLIGEGISRVGSKNVLAAFGMLTAIVAEGAGLALLASTFKPQIQKGAAAMLPVSALLMASAGALLGVVKIAKLKDDNNISWGQVFATMGAMATLVTGIGALAGVAGMIAPSIMAGSLALLAAQGLAAASLVVLSGVVKLSSYAAESLGEDWGKTAVKTVGAAGLVVTEFGVLAGIAGAAAPVVLVGSAALAAVTAVAAKSMSLLDKVIGLRVKMDSAGLDSSAVSSVVSTIKAAVQGFTDLVRSVTTGGVLGTVSTLAKGSALAALMSQVSAVVNALSSVASVVSPDGKIRPAEFVSGKLAAGEAVDILAAAKVITATITEFTGSLTEGFKEISLLSMAKAGAAVKGMSKILDPVSNFVTALSGFESSADGVLHSVKITDDGKVVTGPDIHLVSVARTIASSVSVFAASLFSQENSELWSQFKRGGGRRNPALSNIEVGLGVLSEVIDPVSKFVECLSQFESGDGSALTAPVFDSKGSVTGSRKVNVVRIADSIANAVTGFAKSIASHSSEWEEAFSAGSRTEQRVSKSGLFSTSYEYVEIESGMSKAMGVFGKVITPVVSFVSCLSKFTANGSEISIIDAKGTARKIDLGMAAAKISDAVARFIQSLSSMPTSPGIESSASAVGNILKTTTQPVTEFTQSLAPYAESKPGYLPVIGKNGEVEREVNITAASDNILNCVAAYSKALNEIKSGIIDNTPAIESGSAAVSKYIQGLLDKSSKKDIERVDKLGAAVVKTASSFSKLDNVLSAGSKERVKNINELTEAVKNLKAEVQSESVEKLSNLFTALSNISSSNVRSVIEEINQMRVAGPAGQAGAGPGAAVVSTSAETIKRAIVEALDDAVLTPGSISLKYDSGNKISSVSLGPLSLELDLDMVTER